MAHLETMAGLEKAHQDEVNCQSLREHRSHFCSGIIMIKLSNGQENLGYLRGSENRDQIFFPDIRMGIRLQHLPYPNRLSFLLHPISLDSPDSIPRTRLAFR
jgi:hypothetical protein